MNGILDSFTNSFASLIRSGAKFIVPRFQRDYSWDTDQWDDLWQDILAMRQENGDHYMGYLVLQRTSNSECYIIDGQQRFTTISFIILAAIKAIKRLIDRGIEVNDNTIRVETLTKTFIGNIDPVSLEYDNFLVLNRNNDKYYREYIVKLGELRIRNTSFTEKMMKKCFEWYETKMNELSCSSGKDYAEFVTYVVEHLFFTIINVSDEMNAFKVFETLNARGVQLSSADLLKNYLFSLVDNENSKSRIEALESKWSDLTANIQAEKLPDFIRYYWNSKHKSVRAANLFKAIRENIKQDSEVFALVDDMLSYSDIYMALRDHTDILWHDEDKISDNVRLLNLFSLKQPFPLLMAAYKNLSIKQFGDVLEDIITLMFRYSVICDKNPNDIEKVFNKISIELSQGKGYNRTLLKEVYVEDSTFISLFRNKTFVSNSKNNKVVKYILTKIEQFKGGRDNVSTDDDAVTIEHILPQNPGQEWGDDNYGFDALIYRLGNMCLLKKTANKELENKAYSEKIAAYRESTFATTKSIPERYSIWNGEAIDSRQKAMADCAKSIWELKF